MKKIYILVALFLLLIFNQKVKSEPINLYGFTPASLDSLPWFTQQYRFNQSKNSDLVTLIAEIDKKGKVKSVNLLQEKDSLSLKYVEDFIKKLSFEPALLKNKKVNSTLPIEIEFNKKVNSPIFTFPLYSDTLIKKNRLFEFACELNDIELPKVEYFPSYFSDVNMMDSTNRYPYIIEKLTFNNGKIEKIENLFSTHDAFIQQIESAILYSEITPPKIKGEKVDADVFLKISFFPNQSYPTSRYYLKPSDSSKIIYSHDLKIINIKSTYLDEPIPKNVRSQNLSQNILGYRLNESVDIYLRIDTLGKALPYRVGVKDSKRARAIFKLLSKVKFFPAITQQNELVEYQGYVRIEPVDRFNIRISYLWLE